MRTFFIVVFIFLLAKLVPVQAQSNDVTFPSSDLQKVALSYTGSPLNWPVIVNLADHNIKNNTFTLSPSDVLQLQNLSAVSSGVTKQENRVKNLIGNGATIFAKEQLEKVNQMKNTYLLAIREGNLENALEIGEILESEVDKLEDTLNKNRLVQVQAQLEKKKGEVDKRTGLLGSWADAFVGDLFKESDGLRTLAESFANLAFTDGSTIIVDPNTVAVIRKSRIDKLDESADTEISLVRGGLLAKLSAAGKEKSKYILNAGSSQSDLKTQNFYAESDGESTVKLANYDGVANVSANDVTISIKKNEGTIVKEGEAPAEPIQLLPAPELAWNRKDTIVYREEIIFPFQLVDKAVSYLVQISSSNSFETDLQEIRVANNSAAISGLQLGTTYVRVLAIDNLGLRGPYSETTRVIRNVDNQPPPIFIDNQSGNIVFTLNNGVTITGITEPDTRLTINGSRVAVQRSGRFTYQFQNLRPDQTVSLTAADGSGNITEKPLRIVHLREEELFRFSLSGATGANRIIVNQPTVTISANAYPGLEVLINNEGNERRVQTDSRGRWGITMNMQEGELSITFRDIQSGVSYLTKSFTVEAN